MANILALEAASEYCSVTLKTSSFTQHLVIEEARSHSQHFLPSIRDLLKQQSLALADVDMIACGNGPGSFTGLRICFAMAQGLAYGLNVPLLTVSSLSSMAFFYRQQSNHNCKRIISVLDARMGEVYLGEFEFIEHGGQQTRELALFSIADAHTFVAQRLHDNESEYAIIGPGVALLQDLLVQTGGCELDQSVQPHSSAVAEIAVARWQAGESPAAADAEIVYLRNSVTWDKRKRLRS